MPQETPTQKYFKQTYDAFIAGQATGTFPARPNDSFPDAQQIFERARLAAAEDFVKKANKTAVMPAYDSYFPHVGTNGEAVIPPAAIKITREKIEDFTTAVATAMAVERVMKHYATNTRPTEQEAKIYIHEARMAIMNKYGTDKDENKAADVGGFTHEGGPITKKLKETVGKAGPLPEIEENFKAVRSTKMVESDQFGQLQQSINTLDMLSKTVIDPTSKSGVNIESTEKNMLHKQITDVIKNQKHFNEELSAEGMTELNNVINRLDKAGVKDDPVLKEDIRALNKIISKTKSSIAER
jgi:hypothetical protein